MQSVSKGYIALDCSVYRSSINLKFDQSAKSSPGTRLANFKVLRIGDLHPFSFHTEEPNGLRYEDHTH